MRDPDRAGEPLRRAGALVLQLDVTDPASVDAGVRLALARFGRVDALINNAGYALMGPLEGITDHELDHQFRTNVLGLVCVTRAVLPAMRAAGSGTIVNLSSIGGRVAFPLTSAYHATKFAVEGLSESLRFELGVHNIRVKVVEPGGTRTDFISRGIRWAGHPAYAASVEGWRTFTASIDAKLPGPESAARTIYRAATDTSGRLRYPVNAGPYLLLNRWLPDALWRRMIHLTLRLHAGHSRSRPDGA